MNGTFGWNSRRASEVPQIVSRLNPENKTGVKSRLLPSICLPVFSFHEKQETTLWFDFSPPSSGRRILLLPRY